MALKPWYKVVTPREDLREKRPLDASEFAVHLDQVRDRRAPEDYQDPVRFFDRTYLTKNLTDLAASVVRRLSGIRVETSAVYNLATQFGGGKTHALTLLYHLTQGGPDASRWQGVPSILQKADVNHVPAAAVAVFVGTEFSSLTGRGGDDGTPLRKTPWGEIAYQLNGQAGFEAVREHEEQQIAPSGDVIRAFLPTDRPALILIDELINYVSSYRRTGLSNQLYYFLQNLSETVRGMDNVVMVASVPASELEMTPEDQGDYDRFKKMLDRLGKAMIMSAEAETSEIIRRRLFEWDGLPAEGRETVTAYANWVQAHKAQVGDFPIDRAQEIFEATYPFHPTVLSVFERKWQSLPRFQQTRGVLRLLALWISHVFNMGWCGNLEAPLIMMGTAPLEDALFRTAVFEQLGESRLEGPVMTDIAGDASLAFRLDDEANPTIKELKLHQKVAKTILFESKGGHVTRTEATTPEIRLAVGEPHFDFGNIETVLEALTSTCYYLRVDKNRYRFDIKPNLNKILADRRASVTGDRIDKLLTSEIPERFKSSKVALIPFPTSSNQVPDRPVLTMLVLSPEHAMRYEETKQLIALVTREHGRSSRTFKNALVWVVPDSPDALRKDARHLLACDDVWNEQLGLGDDDRRKLSEDRQKAKCDVEETIWRTYKHVVLLGKDGKLKFIDMGLVHSSASVGNLADLILFRLKQDGDIEANVTPRFLVRNWPPAFKEWSTRAARDAFFASSLLPRLLNPDSIRETIARGVSEGMLAYVSKALDGSYASFDYNVSLRPGDIEISEDTYIIRKETAELYRESLATEPEYPEGEQTIETGVYDMRISEPTEEAKKKIKLPSGVFAKRLKWDGEVPPQKWMNFYTKVLARFVTSGNLSVRVLVDVSSQTGISAQQMDETIIALRELGLSDEVVAEFLEDEDLDVT